MLGVDILVNRAPRRALHRLRRPKLAPYTCPRALPLSRK